MANQTALKRTARAKGPDDQPGNTFRYLYWRLSEKQFQGLCAAILRRKFDPVRCFPVGMADEGIDAISHDSVIYQVKWTSKHLQDPASWLKSTAAKEAEKIKRLVADGRANRYILLTSVGGTTTAGGTGSIQKLQKELDALSESLGIPVECWWQADIDAELDDADDNIKWSYPDMLAGTEAIRYLIFGGGGEGAAARMRETMKRVLAAQSRSDSSVRFSQVEIEGVSLSDLYVDVRASLAAPPRNAAAEFLSNPLVARQKPRGAVDTLLDTVVPLTFLLGVPGQGKSTLTQYLCEVHRSVILASSAPEGLSAPGAKMREPKLPIRVLLKDYAAWVDGIDTFDELRPRVSKRRSARNRSAETYIAQLCAALSGGRNVEVEDVQALLDFYPTLLVFDGLDEVADPELRRIVVEEIDFLTARMVKTSTRVRSFQILVTARPNATGLAEPTVKLFQRLRLEPMDSTLQNEFVIKWCDARGVEGSSREALRRIFRERAALDHVAQLADNPMQLSILLHLINKKGEAVPVARTPLYTDYMGTLMDREVAAGHISPQAVTQVQEVTSFLGWHMQSGVETFPESGEMSRRDIETTLMLYLREVRAEGSDAAELFRVASDRYWALTSETDETFGFAVQPVREYFAARYIAEWGGLEMREPLSKQTVLTNMLGRPYWLNVARFYAGFASPNELAALRYGIESALEMGQAVIEHRVAAWALLMDAVFMGSTMAQRDVVRLLADDLTVMLAREPEYESDFRPLASQSGGAQLATVLREAITTRPNERLASARAEMLRQQGAVSAIELNDWWLSSLAAHAGTDSETAWLKLGRTLDVRPFEATGAHQLTVGDLDGLLAALGVGARTPEDPDLERRYMRAVLDGHASDNRVAFGGEASLLLTTMRPQWFHRVVPGDANRLPPANLHLWLSERDQARRNKAWTQLLKDFPVYEDLRSAARRGQRSQRGTTEQWQAPARELARLHGPCWLAAEIAVTGAAARDLISSGSKDRDGEPFGENTDYGSLLLEVRRKPDAARWRELHHDYPDSLSRRTWALALLAAGSVDAVTQNLIALDSAIVEMSPEDFRAFAGSSSRISQNGSARRLPQVWSEPAITPRTRLVLAHFQLPRLKPWDLPAMSNQELVQWASNEPAYWPVAELLVSRILDNPSMELLPALSRLGIDSLSSISLSSRILREDIAEAILSDPAKYPMEWVLRAEASSQPLVTPVLEDIALNEGWVPSVPRLAHRR